MVPDRLFYRTDCDVQGLSVLMYWPGQLPARASIISGELQAGGNSICLCLTGVLLCMTPPPPRRPPWIACVHFRERFVSYRRLSPLFQFSLSAAALCIQLYGIELDRAKNAGSYRHQQTKKYFKQREARQRKCCNRWSVPCYCMTGVVDPHHADADPNPDPASHFNADPDSHPSYVSANTAIRIRVRLFTLMLIRIRILFDADPNAASY